MQDPMSNEPGAGEQPGTPSTSGIALRARSHWLREAVELFSSMRFAISVLTIIAIASVVGTVVRQNQPMITYVDQFGPFWYEVFKSLSLYTLYTAGWFFVLLAFLVVSTTLCIARNAPRFLREMRDMRDNLREASLRAFGHRLESESALARPALVARVAQSLGARGYRYTLKEHEGATLVAAKAGSLTRLGYIAAHLAIVIMAVGYLLDTDLPIRVQMLAFGKEPISGNMLVSEVPVKSRFGTSNMTFRGNSFIPEGETVDMTIVSYRDGSFVQDLPFTVKLEKFDVEYYPTGMPRLFKSAVVITDKDTGKSFPAEIEVNKPLVHKGIAIYQASFDDGGSTLQMTAWPMRGAADYSFPFEGTVGQTGKLARAGSNEGEYTIEFTGFRAINVENLGPPPGAQATQDQRLRDQVAAAVSSTANAGKDKHLHNVGPSIQYKVRASDGTAREYHNYMLPFELDGRSVFLSGMREKPGDEFKYLRIPADANGKIDEFMRLRAALQNPELRRAAAQRFAVDATEASQPAALRDQMAVSAERTLALFAQQGYASVAGFIERSVPADQREQAAQMFMRILEGSLWDLWQAARAQAGLPPAENTEANGGWLAAASNALSDGFFYGAPVLLQLRDFKQVQASVLQMTRSPGKNIVYFGCLLLVIGVFAMFYIRERRIWVWIKDAPDGPRSHLTMAMSATRRTLDFEREFAAVRDELAAQAADRPASAG